MRVLFFLLLLPFQIKAQDMQVLPFYDISEITFEDYSSGHVIARMIDGLGYRYYWASYQLDQAALEYKPSPDAQDMMETLRHIYGLAETILKTAKGEENLRPYAVPSMDYETLRSQTLIFLKEARDIFAQLDDTALLEMEIVFTRGDRKSQFPIWNLINGQISDALYHTGQVVSFRRTAGNPILSGVNVFIGKTRE